MSPPDSPAIVNARKRAILLVIGASATFTVAAACVKGLAGEIPLAQVIFCRNAFALPILVALLMRAGGLSLMRPRSPLNHLLRTIFGLTGMSGAFAGFTHLPLATATVLGFTMPLFLTAFSVLFLGERVGWRRWTAVVVGFAGVLLVARPGLGEALPLVPVLLVLMGAVGWALSMMTIRRMGEAGEHGVAIVMWFAIGSSVLSGMIAIPAWVAPDPHQWMLLIGLGAISAIAQLLMTEGYRRGETTMLAPFEYAGLFFTMLIGVLFWREWPGVLDLLGFAVLVGAGLFIWWRETKLGLRP